MNPSLHAPRLTTIRALVGVSALLAPFVEESELPDPWPRQTDAPAATVLLYQPQVERLDGDLLKGRAAVSVLPKGEEEPVLGAIWYTARLETDTEARTAHLIEARVPRVRFPGSTPEQEARLSALIEKEAPAWDITISLDRLSASLASAERALVESSKLSTPPPRILFLREPAVLVVIDGEPKLVRVGDGRLMRVVNCPFLIVRESSLRAYYLYAGKRTWYRAEDMQGEWELADEVPADVAALAPDESKSQLAALDDEAVENVVPKIVVATEPTELLFTTGEPEYTPVGDGALMYVSNTDSDLFLEVESQRHHVLLSGRWYAGKSLEDGPWAYVERDQLPGALSAIPADSEPVKQWAAPIQNRL